MIQEWMKKQNLHQNKKDLSEVGKWLKINKLTLSNLDLK